MFGCWITLITAGDLDNIDLANGIEDNDFTVYPRLCFLTYIRHFINASEVTIAKMFFFFGKSNFIKIMSYLENCSSYTYVIIYWGN